MCRKSDLNLFAANKNIPTHFKCNRMFRLSKSVLKLNLLINKAAKNHQMLHNLFA